MSAEGSDVKKSPVGSIQDDEKRPHSQQRPESSDDAAVVDDAITRANIKLANPLAGISHEKLMENGAEFARTHGLGDSEDLFRKGALAAQDPLAFDDISHFTEEEKAIFRREFTHRWDHPTTLYYLVILCSVAAAVQGVSSFMFRRVLSNQYTSDGRSRHKWRQFIFCAAISHRPQFRQSVSESVAPRPRELCSICMRRRIKLSDTSLADLPCSCVAPSLVAGSPNP